jgi:hypothetical protein
MMPLVKAAAIQRLAEAWAWLVAPDQPHGAAAPPGE